MAVVHFLLNYNGFSVKIILRNLLFNDIIIIDWYAHIKILDRMLEEQVRLIGRFLL